MIEQTPEGGNEIVRHRAADATVGQLHDPVFGAALDAAALQNLAVDADVAEFVDDHRKAAPTGILENMANECCLAGAEEARDDCAGNFGKGCHQESSFKFLFARPRAAELARSFFLRVGPGVSHLP